MGEPKGGRREMTALCRQSRSSGHDVEHDCLGYEIEEGSGVDVIDVRKRERERERERER